MLKKSLISMSACALSLSSNVCVAVDIVSGDELTGITVSGSDFVPAGGGTLGVDNLYDYWDANPGYARVIGPATVNTNIDLGVNGGRQLWLQQTGGVFRINADINGSIISGEGGSLTIGADYFDTSGELTALFLGETQNSHLNNLDSIDVNAQAFRIEHGSTLTLGEGDSFKQHRRWLGGELPDSTAFVNDGLVEQLGAGSLVDIRGVFVNNNRYVLQGGTLKVQENVFIGGTATNNSMFDQYAGSSNIIQGYLSVTGTYNMYGGQLTADAIAASSSDFNYVDGGVFVRNQDIEIRSGGLLKKDLVMDVGERFGSRNLIVGTDIADSGSVTIDGGSNRVYENLTINAGGSVVQNSGLNSIDGHLVMESGSTYTMNGGQLTADHITGSASSPAYFLWVNGFNYVDGGVWLKNASIDIRSPGLFGDTLLIDESGETFGAANMHIGMSAADSGLINQTAGKNLISNQLSIEAGGRYDMSGGRLEFGSFVGPGKINFTGGEIYAGSNMNIGVGGALGESVVLYANKTLSLQAEGDFRNPRNDLTVDAGADLTLDGGTLIANRIIKTGDFNYVSGQLDLNTLTFGGTGLFGDFTVTNDHSLYVRNDVTIEAGTTVTVESGNISGGATINNSGNLVLNGGSLDGSQINNIGAGSFGFARGNLSLDSLNVSDTGLLGKTVELDSSRTINVSSVNVEAGSRLEISGGTSSASNLTNEGVVDIAAAGHLNAGTYTQDGSTAVTTVNGSLNADVVVNDGKLMGSGEINGNLFNGGEFAPANSPGVLHVTGDFTQSEFGLLNIEIGGLLSGDEYDVVNIDGIADLGGTLDVDLYDLGGGLFAPSLGHTFDFLTAETITGDFDLLTLMALGNGLAWQLDYLYDEIGTTDIARLSVVEASVVPVPAAIWLFGSGLLCLVGIARRKKV